jgi:hypothetical protein
MKSKLPTRCLLAISLVAFANHPIAAAPNPLGTAFTYQGRLAAGGSPANGEFDLRLALYDSTSNSVGSPLFNPAVSVSNGFFTTTLDFGPGVFDGTPYWLEVALRPTGGNTQFRVLAPRQRLSGTPYALFAANAASAATANAASFASLAANSSNALNAVNATTATQAASANSVPWSGITGLPLGFADGIDNDTTYTAGAGITLVNGRFNIDFAGSGLSTSVAHSDHVHVASDITVGVLAEARIDPLLARDSEVFPLVLASDGSGSGLDADKLDGFDATEFWHINGNAGTTAGVHFLGTTDNADLEMRVRNTTALRLRSGSASGGPNVVGGSSLNTIGANVSGVAIGGGTANSGSSDLVAIGGGRDNQVSGPTSSIGGGQTNRIQGAAAARIGGGSENTIATNAHYASIGGGQQNGIQSNASASRVGGGSSNIVGGSATFSTISGGARNTVNTRADYATIGGGGQNLVAADANLATIPGGGGAQARNYAQFAYAGGMFGSAGDAQSGMYVLRNSTTNAAPTDLFLDGTGEPMHVPLSGRWIAHIQVVAAGPPGSGLSAGFTTDVVVKNITGTAALVGAQPVTLQAIAQEGAPCLVTITTSGDALVVRVTGPTNPQAVRWVATVRTTELAF